MDSFYNLIKVIGNENLIWVESSTGIQFKDKPLNVLISEMEMERYFQETGQVTVYDFLSAIAMDNEQLRLDLALYENKAELYSGWMPNCFEDTGLYWIGFHNDITRDSNNNYIIEIGYDHPPCDGARDCNGSCFDESYGMYSPSFAEKSSY